VIACRVRGQPEVIGQKAMKLKLKIGCMYKFWINSDPTTGRVVCVIDGWVELDVDSEVVYVNLLHVDSITKPRYP
jgi:hypothetical protein